MTIAIVILAITNGIAIIGFKTIGIPKIKGSLILNNEGINDNLPKALYLDDLAVKTITSANPKVAAVPPNLTKLAIN